MSKDKKPTAPEQQEDKKEEPAAEESTKEINSEEINSQDIKPEKQQGKKEAQEAKQEKSEKPEKAEKPEKPSAADELAALNDKYLRVCAEYDNFRKRSQREKDGLYADIKAETLKKFLPIYDNLVRALEQPTVDEAYRRGVEMIMTQFNSTMEKLGVSEIESLGKKFDSQSPQCCDACGRCGKGRERNMWRSSKRVFSMGDKVIRFAMVKVAN